MALHRGIQSAIFYYVSCAPCSEVRIRKKRKQDAKNDRAARQQLELEMPNLYRHPSPSSTNPHWQADIALGPTIQGRGRRKPTTAPGDKDSQRGLRSRTGSGFPSSVDVSRVGSRNGDDRFDSKWKVIPDQREDDELWGESKESEPQLRSYLDGSSVRSGVARPPKAKIAAPKSSCQSFRNPPVSDMLPAIVTRVENREDVAWMMQPPPVAEVMSGKQQPPRSRSDSGSSRPTVSTTGSNAPLSRQLMERRLQAAEQPLAPGASRESISRSAATPRGQSHDRLAALGGVVRSPSKEKRRPQPITVTRDSEDSDITIIHRPSLVPKAATEPRGVATRPQLSTILSDSIHPADEDDHSETYTRPSTPTHRKENSQPHSDADDSSGQQYRDKTSRRSAILVKDSSHEVLQDFAPKHPAFNTRIFAASSPGGKASKMPHSPPASQFDGEERRQSGATELFDSWGGPEFELDKWVHEHTKREVKTRWSMDL